VPFDPDTLPPTVPQEVIFGLMSDVTRILDAIEQGDPHAASQLLPLVYGELRRLAAQKLVREAPGQTLTATGLVHEAYLRLVTPSKASSDQGKGGHWDSRGHVPESGELPCRLRPGPRWGGTANDNFPRLWDVETGHEIRRFKGHSDAILGVAFSPDGRRALSASFDGIVRLWDVASGQERTLSPTRAGCTPSHSLPTAGNSSVAAAGVP